MKIETTVYLDEETMDGIKRLAEREGASFSCMVSVLLNDFPCKGGQKPRAWSRVRYRDRDEEESRKRKHLYLKQDEYEFFIDLRKVYKLSVSYIITIALNAYLYGGKMQGCADNYRYRNYAIVHFMAETVHCWLMCWGVPPYIPDDIFQK